MDDLQLVALISEKVDAVGGKCYYVGGCVRDKLLGVKSKDIDVEVHGVLPSLLEEILDSIGTRMEYGKSFGIYSLKGSSVDIALPRSEHAVGRGHRDFKIDVDPFIGEKRAAERRDFTINAFMEDTLTGQISDFFGGQKDLKEKVLRHIHDSHFAEDPLRVLRAAQFAARFSFSVAPETVELCRKMDLSTLSRERVFEELKKALLLAEKPSVFFEVLRNMEQLSCWFPEVEALIDIPQNSKYHLEGDVYTHTMMVLDEAAKLRSQAQEPLMLMLSALVHDFGKVPALQIDKEGYAHAFDHENLGIPLVEAFCKRLSSEKHLESYLVNMTRLHMKPNMMAATASSVKNTNHLFDESILPEDLLLLCYADSKGMISPLPFISHNEFLKERLAVYHEYLLRPYVTGKDLLAAGLPASEHFSDILAYAHKLRLSGVQKNCALKQTLAYANTQFGIKK